MRWWEAAGPDIGADGVVDIAVAASPARVPLAVEAKALGKWYSLADEPGIRR